MQRPPACQPGVQQSVAAVQGPNVQCNCVCICIGNCICICICTCICVCKLAPDQEYNGCRSTSPSCSQNTFASAHWLPLLVSRWCCSKQRLHLHPHQQCQAGHLSGPQQLQGTALLCSANAFVSAFAYADALVTRHALAAEHGPVLHQAYSCICNIRLAACSSCSPTLQSKCICMCKWAAV